MTRRIVKHSKTKKRGREKNKNPREVDLSFERKKERKETKKIGVRCHVFEKPVCFRNFEPIYTFRAGSSAIDFTQLGHRKCFGTK